MSATQYSICRLSDSPVTPGLKSIRERDPGLDQVIEGSVHGFGRPRGAARTVAAPSPAPLRDDANSET